MYGKVLLSSFHSGKIEPCTTSSSRDINWYVSCIFFWQTLVTFSKFFRGRVLPPSTHPPTDGASGYNRAHSIQYSRIKSQKNLLRNLMYFYHRVSIEWKSPYKESYTVNSHWKSFDDVMGDVRACVRFQN